ncbi:MAG: hypothetical protein WBX25_18320 [Rhodomicrobium sp.]
MFPADLAFEFAAAIYDITVEGEGQIMVRMAKVTIAPGEAGASLCRAGDLA